jgi:hypothetical protein
MQKLVVRGVHKFACDNFFGVIADEQTTGKKRASDRCREGLVALSHYRTSSYLDV